MFGHDIGPRLYSVESSTGHHENEHELMCTLYWVTDLTPKSNLFVPHCTEHIVQPFSALN